MLFWLGDIHYPVSDCWSILLHLLVCCWFPLVYFSFLLIYFSVVIGSFLYLLSHCCSSHQVHPFSRVQWTTLRLLIWTFYLVNCLSPFYFFPLVLSCFLICRLFLCLLILPLCICFYILQLYLSLLKDWLYVSICGPSGTRVRSSCHPLYVLCMPSCCGWAASAVCALGEGADSCRGQLSGLATTAVDTLVGGASPQSGCPWSLAVTTVGTLVCKSCPL